MLADWRSTLFCISGSKSGELLFQIIAVACLCTEVEPSFGDLVIVAFLSFVVIEP